jgi:hypothetical protein
MRYHRSSLLILLSFLLAVSLAGAHAFTIAWSTIDGGGGTSLGGKYELDGTIGQPDASPEGAMTGGGYSLTGGYWAVILPACESYAPVDFDRDCDVDLEDFAVWASCAGGGGIPHDGSVICQAADLDNDDDVDQVDFAAFQRCFSGARIADPDCAD